MILVVGFIHVVVTIVNKFVVAISTLVPKVTWGVESLVVGLPIAFASVGMTVVIVLRWSVITIWTMLLMKVVVAIAFVSMTTGGADGKNTIKLCILETRNSNVHCGPTNFNGKMDSGVPKHGQC